MGWGWGGVRKGAGPGNLGLSSQEPVCPGGRTVSKTRRTIYDSSTQGHLNDPTAKFRKCVHEPGPVTRGHLSSAK